MLYLLQIKGKEDKNVLKEELEKIEKAREILTDMREEEDKQDRYAALETALEALKEKSNSLTRRIWG